METKTKKALLFHGSVLALVSVFVMWAVILWWAYVPVHVLSVSASAETLKLVGTELVPTNTFNLGDVLYYRLAVCKNLPLEATVYRQLVNTVVLPLETITSNLPVGCSMQVRSVGPLDTQAFIGTYQLRLVPTFKVNPIRTEHYEIVSNKFTVLP